MSAARSAGHKTISLLNNRRSWTRAASAVRLCSMAKDDGGTNDGGSRRFAHAAAAGGGAVAVLAVGYVLHSRRQHVLCAAAAEDKRLRPPPRADLPVYRLADIAAHKDITGGGRIWTTYKNGVYDITDFVAGHPGGDKILMAAGARVEPYWELYAQHFTEDVMHILEEMRIGTLHNDDVVIKKESSAGDGVWANEPTRHPALIVTNQQPFNAELPPALLNDTFHTPNALFFVRNHLPVPKVDEQTHRLTIASDTDVSARARGLRAPLTLSVSDLRSKRFKPHTIHACIQCAGNRRKLMAQHKSAAGLSWQATAISNARWTGVRLRDLLREAGINETDGKHVQFVGADIDPTGAHYGASITIAKAFHPDTIIAYAMNDEPIPIDHGFPLRLIAPGTFPGVTEQNIYCYKNCPKTNSQQDDGKPFAQSS